MKMLMTIVQGLFKFIVIGIGCAVIGLGSSIFVLAIYVLFFDHNDHNEFIQLMQDKPNQVIEVTLLCIGFLLLGLIISSSFKLMDWFYEGERPDYTYELNDIRRTLDRIESNTSR